MALHRRGPVRSDAGLVQQVRRQCRDVGDAVSQGRHGDLDDPKPVVQILPELAGHTHLGTTQRYIDVNDDMLRKAVEII